MPSDWVKRLGQWHLSGDDHRTKCGCPMLGNNYARVIPEDERTKCKECHGIYDAGASKVLVDGGSSL